MSNEEQRRIAVELLTKNLSSRYGRLTADVLRRLPNGWDEYRTFRFEETTTIPTTPSGGKGYASALREEEAESLPMELPLGVEPEQTWRVILYTRHLDELSDETVRYVITHELGHVASGLPCGSLVLGEAAYTRTGPDTYASVESKSVHEEAADRFVMEWGFTGEFQCYLRENDLLA